VYTIAKVAEEVNRKSPPRNTMEQLSTPYTDPERHNTHYHRQNSIVLTADPTVYDSHVRGC